MRWTRRRFLSIAAASVAAAACSPQKLLNPPPKVRVVFYTDVQARPERSIAPALAAAGVAIGSQRADVVIAGGDMVAAGIDTGDPAARSMWISYGSMLATIGGRVHHVIGDRDLVGPRQALQRGADPRAIVREKLGSSRTYGSFDAADYHFVLLDSVEVTRDKPGYRGFIGAEQLDWLASDLARIPSTQPVIAATHMPLRTAAFGQTEAGGGPADQVVVNARQVIDILMRRQLVLVLQGHSHRSDAIQEAGVTFLSGGAISGPGWNDDHGGATPGFVVASVRPERVDWQYVGYGER